MKKLTKIPSNWQTRKIGDVCDVVAGSTPSTSKPQFWGDEIVWVTPYDLSKISSRFISTSKKKITSVGLKSCSANLIPERSLVMSSRAPIGYFAINTVKLATNQGCKSFVCSNSVDVEFLYYYLSYYVYQIHKLGAGSTFSEVGKKALTDLPIRLPEVKEQKTIAEILSSVDSEIEKIEAIINKTEKLKSGLMQDLLSGRVRVPG